jgi:hypothetical protein
VRKALLTITLFVLLIMALGLGAVALKPDWRTALQRWANPHQRQVIATAHGRFVANKAMMKAVKSVDENGVFVEIFEEHGPEDLSLFATIRTGNPQDGQFNFEGRMSHLVASDMDHDGIDELLVPSFDDQHRPRLNVYKYQPALNEFQEISPHLSDGE